jgi:hypothetical protein
MAGLAHNDLRSFQKMTTSCCSTMLVAVQSVPDPHRRTWSMKRPPLSTTTVVGVTILEEAARRQLVAETIEVDVVVQLEEGGVASSVEVEMVAGTSAVGVVVLIEEEGIAVDGVVTRESTFCFLASIYRIEVSSYSPIYPSCAFLYSESTLK